MLAPLLDAVAPCARAGAAGRSADRTSCTPTRGYGYRRCRAECVARGVRHRIARRMVEPSNRLGRHRRVVERTMA